MTSLTLVRRIAARPSFVFEALTTAERVCAWRGPDDLPVIQAEIDTQVGGAYRVRFQTLDGLEHEAFGEYLEIGPPRRLVMSWRYAFGGAPEELGALRPLDLLCLIDAASPKNTCSPFRDRKFADSALEEGGFETIDPARRSQQNCEPGVCPTACGCEFHGAPVKSSIASQ